jgi:hypothetical protein
MRVREGEGEGKGEGKGKGEGEGEGERVRVRGRGRGRGRGRETYQMGTQLTPLPQFQPCSTWHWLEQPSPDKIFLSSLPGIRPPKKKVEKKLGPEYFPKWETI